MKILKSYQFSNLLTVLFLLIRNFLVPWSKVTSLVKSKSSILDYGSGHGLFSFNLNENYSNKLIDCYDIDHQRINFSKKLISKNNYNQISFHYKDKDLKQNYDFINLFGILYLLDPHDQEILLKRLTLKMKKGSILLLHDIFKDNSFNYKIHMIREKLFRYIGFTKGKSLDLYTEKHFLELLEKCKLKIIKKIDLKIPFCKTFTWLITKKK